MSQKRVKILVPSNKIMNGLLGVRDQNLSLIEAVFEGTQISARGNEITLAGENSEMVAELFEELISLLESGHDLDSASLNRVIDMHKAAERPSQVLTQEILRTPTGVVVSPKSAGQKRYVEAVQRNVISFVTGPAGTGKSWLAVAMAIHSLKSEEAEKIILTRPVVEAGERLGFLPGDFMAKVDPYFRPLYDALAEFLTPEGMNRLLDQGVLEVAPLAYMRGRTLNNSFVILDEAQNTTPEQMKMFLTRLGFGSKAVVTGDITQIDVQDKRSGLKDLEIILGGVEGLEFVSLSKRDVVRHPIVAQIVAAYDDNDS